MISTWAYLNLVKNTQESAITINANAGKPQI